VPAPSVEQALTTLTLTPAHREAGRLSSHQCHTHPGRLGGSLPTVVHTVGRLGGSLPTVVHTGRYTRVHTGKYTTGYTRVHTGRYTPVHTGRYTPVHTGKHIHREVYLSRKAYTQGGIPQ